MKRRWKKNFFSSTTRLHSINQKNVSYLDKHNILFVFHSQWIQFEKRSHIDTLEYHTFACTSTCTPSISISFWEKLFWIDQPWSRKRSSTTNQLKYISKTIEYIVAARKWKFNLGIQIHQLVSIMVCGILRKSRLKLRVCEYEIANIKVFCSPIQDYDKYNAFSILIPFKSVAKYETSSILRSYSFITLELQHRRIYFQPIYRSLEQNFIEKYFIIILLKIICHLQIR